VFKALAWTTYFPNHSVAPMRHVKKGRQANSRRGFYLILRPEDRTHGASDPVRWIEPLVKNLKLDYRIALLRAAAFHGSSHQAAMVFQVVATKQIRGFDVGRQRLELIYQSPVAFRQVNRPDWLNSIKSEAGFAKVAGLELMLLDCARYFQRRQASAASRKLPRTWAGRRDQTGWPQSPRTTRIPR